MIEPGLNQDYEELEIPHRHQKKINWFLLVAYISIIFWSIYYFIAYSK